MTDDRWPRRTPEPEGPVRYLVFEAAPFGAVRIAGELEAASDQDALKQARKTLPHGPGELRQAGRVVCRFGRAKPFLLQR
jgi:hypothetical protein